jgi:hypothetical protein
MRGRHRQDRPRHPYGRRPPEALGDDLTDIAGTSLDKGVELDALAKMDAPARVAL